MAGHCDSGGVRGAGGGGAGAEGGQGGEWWVERARFRAFDACMQPLEASLWSGGVEDIAEGGGRGGAGEPVGSEGGNGEVGGGGQGGDADGCADVRKGRGGARPSRYLVRAEWQRGRCAEGFQNPQISFWAERWNRVMVLAVARVFVAAIAAQASLRMALGRFLTAPPPDPSSQQRTSRALPAGQKGAWEDDSEWLWGESGVCEGPLQEAVLAGLQGSDSVVVIEGGRRACGCGQALVRPDDLSEAVLSDDEVFDFSFSCE